MESTPFYIRDQKKRASIATIIQSPFYYNPKVMCYFLTTMPDVSEWIFENNLSGQNENMRAFRNLIGKRVDVETNHTSLTNRFTIQTTLSDVGHIVIPLTHQGNDEKCRYLVLKIFVPCDHMHKNTRIDNVVYKIMCGVCDYTEFTGLVSSCLKGNSLWLMIRYPTHIPEVYFYLSVDVDINEIMIYRP